MDLSGEAVDLLACPRCGGPLRAERRTLFCPPCASSYAVLDGIPELRRAADPRTEAVREFYARAPFPGYPPHDSLPALRERARRSDFARLLDEALAGDARVAEIGCGTGQMSLFLAGADRMVIGADLARPSLALAAAHARSFGVERVTFVETDLRAPGLREAAFDLVLATGVLHHTPDPRASFAAIARLARPGGIVVVGVYHAFARLPHRLRRAVARLTGYRLVPFDPVLRDRSAERDRREAWFRDQYRHVEEHCHTLGEVRGWFCENGIEYLRTVPGTLLAEEPIAAKDLFSPPGDDWPLESVLAQIGWARTLAREGGLFIVLGVRSARIPRVAEGILESVPSRG